ncbi:hypothetical protein BD560DRAFT_490041 [Blakeslea trispora]|nr:hypothetical protein BD560DRAFT_490041 [Blakeslea trispora]
MHAEEVAFRMQTNAVTMVVKLCDPKLIAHARDLVYGRTTKDPHIQGKIVKKADPINYPWSYTLDPNSVSFFSGKNTRNGNSSACDIGIRWAEYYLDDICHYKLPDCFWCPTNSTMIEEIKKDLNMPSPPPLESKTRPKQN